MTKPLFIDAHVHFWDLGRLDHPWLTPPFDDDTPNGNVAAIASDYGPAEYRAEAEAWNPGGAVHVEAGARPDLAEAEAAWASGLAKRDGLPNAIVAYQDLAAPDYDARLAALASMPLVRGIRHIVNWHPDPRLTYTDRDVTGDDAWARGFARLAAHGLSFDLQAYPGQFPALARLIARHPDIPVIVNHAGMGVDPGAEGHALWKSGMAALAACPNVSVKLSGLGFVFRPWDAAAARDRVIETIDIFGPGRAMIASDFPTDRLFAGFDETLTMLSDSVTDFGEDERRAMFAGNANRIYRLGLAP